MSSVVIGCDINASNDHDWQNTVAKELENNGHTTEKLAIAPNPFAAYSYSSKAKGKIGVYIIADGLFSIGDLYYGNTSFKYAYFLIRGDLGHKKMDSYDDFKKNPIAADADTRGEAGKLAGKTFPQMNEITKSKCIAVWGGTSPKEGAKNLIKAMGGDTDGDSSSSSGSTIKTALQEVLYDWNGDVECYLRDDTIYINRIPDPTSAKLSLVEGDNVFLDGISVSDINPGMPNKLVVNWGNSSFEIKDDARIKRFGEIKKTLSSSEKKEEDVIDFAYREWNKLLKDSGRKLECKVDGDSKWRIGKWVRVYIPSFDLNGFMYITKVSHDDDGEWETGLTLEDYPPDLGKKPSANPEDETEESEETEEEEE